MFKKGQETQQRFTIKKFKIGAASVLVGTVFLGHIEKTKAHEHSEPTSELVATGNANDEELKVELPATLENEKGTKVEEKSDSIDDEKSVSLEETSFSEIEKKEEMISSSNEQTDKIIQREMSTSASIATEKKTVSELSTAKSNAMPKPDNQGNSFYRTGIAFRTVSTSELDKNPPIFTQQPNNVAIFKDVQFTTTPIAMVSDDTGVVSMKIYHFLTSLKDDISSLTISEDARISGIINLPAGQGQKYTRKLQAFDKNNNLGSSDQFVIYVIDVKTNGIKTNGGKRFQKKT